MEGEEEGNKENGQYDILFNCCLSLYLELSTIGKSAIIAKVNVLYPNITFPHLRMGVGISEIKENIECLKIEIS